MGAKTSLRRVEGYQALAFICPGCRDWTSGLHLLPVNTTEKTPSWDWNGDLEKPTLSPSIHTRYSDQVCHSFLRDGVFEFLSDSTHSLSGQKVEIPELGDWFNGTD